MNNDPRKRTIVALDGMSMHQALGIARLLNGRVWGFKVNDLIYQDIGIISRLKGYGNVFVDLKLYDIPNTVSNSVRRISGMGADIITVHASGGIAMMAAAKGNAGRSKIIGVTLLTSFKREAHTGDAVYGLAKSAQEAGLDGIVCSGDELEKTSGLASADLIRIVPGIRNEKIAHTDDQSRTISAQEAFDKGADLIVVGRPVTRVTDPVLALEQLFDTNTPRTMRGE